MPTNTMSSDEAFLDAVRQGCVLSQDEISEFVGTHDIVDAQYDGSGDGERLVRIYRIGDANIAISPEESDADQGTFRWNQPCEVRRVPMKRVIELHRWLPVASDPFTTMVGDDVEVPLATDYVTAVVKRTRRILVEEGIRPADIRIANLQHRYENDGDGTRRSIVCLIRTRQGMACDIVFDFPDMVPTCGSELSGEIEIGNPIISRYQVDTPSENKGS